MTLADLLNRAVQLEWQEGVSIVRAVLDQLTGTAASGNVFPELDEIDLSDSGGVDLTGTSKVSDPVKRVGQLLQALLARSEPPVQLRLLVSQAMAPTPTFGSLREYNEALAYFERPNRAEVLSGLYVRADQAAPVLRGDHAATLDAIAPLPQATTKVKAEKPVVQRKRSRAKVVGIAAILALAIGGFAGLYVLNAGSNPPSRAEMTALAERATASLGGAMVSGLSKVTETVGLGRLVSPEEAPSPPPTAPPAPATVRRPAGPKKIPAEMSAPSVSFSAFDLDLLPAPGPALDDAGTDAAGLREPAANPSIIVQAASGDATIYSSASEGVLPPVGVRPQLPRALPSGIDPADLGQIELIIAIDGTVESVKLLGVPRTVRDSMLLSAAKAWEFEPAIKNGLPVRYRKTVWVAP